MAAPWGSRGDGVKGRLQPIEGFRQRFPGAWPFDWAPMANRDSATKSPYLAWLTTQLGSWKTGLKPGLVERWAMRSLFILLAGAVLIAGSAASADTRVFIVANQADGYGIDQCLANGEACGGPAARAYCRARDFAQATAFQRVDPDEVTGSVPKSGSSACSRNSCGEYVAITCQR